jgi:hypothetical protein
VLLSTATLRTSSALVKSKLFTQKKPPLAVLIRATMMFSLNPPAESLMETVPAMITSPFDASTMLATREGWLVQKVVAHCRVPDSEVATR